MACGHLQQYGLVVDDGAVAGLGATAINAACVGDAEHHLEETPIPEDRMQTVELGIRMCLSCKGALGLLSHRTGAQCLGVVTGACRGVGENSFSTPHWAVKLTLPQWKESLDQPCLATCWKEWSLAAEDWLRKWPMRQKEEQPP
eukprot:3493176-Amphidinium_carterae.2